MATRPQLCLLSSLLFVLTGCYREHTADEDLVDTESDASAAVATDAGNAVAADAGCNGQDAISQLLCQLGQQGARTDAGAAQQQGLQDLLNGLLGAAGGLAGAGGTSGTGALGGLAGAGGAGGIGGLRRDAGRPQTPAAPDPSGWRGFGRRDSGAAQTAPGEPAAQPGSADAGAPPSSADAGAPPSSTPGDAGGSDATTELESADAAVIP